MRLELLKENLIRRGYEVTIAKTAKECADYLDEKIDGTTVGIGGSVTVAQLGLYERLKTHNRVLWHGDKALVEELGNKAVRDLAIDTEIYISSVNGVSEDGVIVNIDYTGNRIAATCYGHKKVYLLVGKNKIAPDFEKTLWRARNIASPQNAMRLGRKTPCALRGDKCYDCNSPERICNGFLVFDRAMAGMPTEVILIDEELGY